MKLKIYTDGASNGNPGIIGLGIVIHKPNEQIERISKEEGYGTNNEAELIAVEVALKKAKELDATEVDVLTDSALTVKWIKKVNKCKKPHLKSILDRILTLIRHFKTFSIDWIAREQNADADELANKASGIKQDICDLCGSKMVLRFRKNDGYPFFGCTNFPQCNKSIHLSKEEASIIMAAKQNNKSRD
ncbi:MAG: reverse transcriptase-like protein [Candidatus Margulisiibacteriota bacterium]